MATVAWKQGLLDSCLRRDHPTPRGVRLVTATFAAWYGSIQSGTNLGRPSMVAGVVFSTRVFAYLRRFGGKGD